VGLKGIVVVCGLAGLFAAVPAARDGSRIERGRYLVERVSMCGECHTPRNNRGELDRNRWLKGAPIPVKSPFKGRSWAFQAPPIGGLHGWKPAEVARILEKGARSSGRRSRPPMPGFRMSREDAQAVAAYLQSLR